MGSEDSRMKEEKEEEKKKTETRVENFEKMSVWLRRRRREKILHDLIFVSEKNMSIQTSRRPDTVSWMDLGYSKYRHNMT